MKAFPRLRFLVGQAVTGLRRSAGVTVVSIVTISLVLGLLATFATVLANLSRVADDLGENVEVSVYLIRGTSDETGQARALEVAGWPTVAEARYVTSTAAMAWLRSSLGPDAIVVDGLPVEVLPPSVEVRLSSRRWTADEVDRVATSLAELGGVEEVRYGKDEIERLHALLGFAQVAALVISIVLGLGAMLIVSNTIRLAVYARRDEIEIMTLVGATESFVRTPFVIEGGLQGLLGGLLAVGGLALMRELLVSGLRRGLGYAYGPIELQFAPVQIFVGVLAVGVILGLIGSALAVGKFVRA